MDLELHERLKRYWRDYVLPHWLYPEMAALRHGLRRVILVERASPDMAARIAGFWARHGISARPVSGPEGRGIIGFADRRAAAAFVKASVGRGVTARGRLLGYPECCIRFHAAERSDVNAINTFRRSRRFSWLLNNVSSEIKLVSHFPCSYDCRPSRELAGAILRIAGREHGFAAAADIAAMLRHKVACHEGSFFCFRRLGAPFRPPDSVAARFGLAPGELMTVRRDRIAAVSGGATRTITGSFQFFDFK